MLKKLLKYDLSTVMKYWWIAVVTTIGMSVLGGFSLSVLTVETVYVNPFVYIIAFVMLIVTIFTYSAFSILSVVFIFVRFYKNFFTDEGYLTFTLPVKRSQLLNSKVITAVITTSATTVVTISGLVAILGIGLARVNEFWEMLNDVVNEVIDYFGAYTIVYIAELILIMFLITLSSTLFLFNCITFGSVIAKKAKVMAAIGIYYGANMIQSFIIQTFTLSVTTDLIIALESVPEESIKLLIALVMLAIILIVGLVCALLYTLQYWMLDKKLNLS